MKRLYFNDIFVIKITFSDCLFIYNNSYARANTFELWRKKILQLNGAFLITGSLDFGKVGMTFERRGLYEVISFEVDPGRYVTVSGIDSSGTVYKQSFTATPSSSGDFNIIFSVQRNSIFFVWYEDTLIPRERLQFDYDGKNVEFSGDKQFFTVDSVVQKTTNFNGLNFIYNCPREEPVACKGGRTSLPPYNLQQNIILQCKGTGIGPLSVSWSVENINPPEKISTALNSVMTKLDPYTASTVSSEINIKNFSLIDQSVYVCAVTDFLGRSSSFVFKLFYTHNITFTGDDYFTKGQLGAVFIFYMVGWPLKLQSHYNVSVLLNYKYTVYTVHCT